MATPSAPGSAEDDLLGAELADVMDEEEDPDPSPEEAGAGDDGEVEFERLLDPLLEAYDLALAPPDPEASAFLDDAPRVEVDAGVPPPPLPPPLDPPAYEGRAPPVANRRRRRGGDELHLVLPTGEITYFPSNGNFEARCFAHADERCTLTRKGGFAAASSRGGQPLRPLGLLAAWLDLSTVAFEKSEHKDLGA